MLTLFYIDYKKLNKVKYQNSTMIITYFKTYKISIQN